MVHGLYLHIISPLPGFVNPRWSEDGRPHAHCQLTDEATRRHGNERRGGNKTQMNKCATKR